MKTPLLLLTALLLAACGGEVVTRIPGRGGAVSESGPVARVTGRQAGPEAVPHGLWRGVNAAGDRVWELRYTRGLPSGPYREWDAQGQLTATWPYDWEGRIVGWARWFVDGVPDFKFEIQPEQAPDFDPVGNAAALRDWAEALAASSAAPAE